MARELLSDEQWEQISPHLPPEQMRGRRSYIAPHRQTVEGILWIARTGAPWRDLPERYGKWITVYQRFRRWSQKGLFRRVLEAMMGEMDLDVAMIDGTYLKAHQHSAGACKEGLCSEKSKVQQAIGKAPGGLASKVVAVCDKEGRIAAFTLAPGPRSEVKLADDVIGQINSMGRFLADRAYDSRALRTRVEGLGAEAVIPSRRTVKRPPPCDMEAYKARHLVENAFADIKHYRGIATRYCKLALTFTEMLSLVCFMVNTRETRRGVSPYLA